MAMFRTTLSSRALFPTEAAPVASSRRSEGLRHVKQHGRRALLASGYQSMEQSRRNMRATDASEKVGGTSTSTASTNTHVVIASFGEPEPYHAVSLYFASRLKGATVHHVVMHTYGEGHEPGELPLNVVREERSGGDDVVSQHHRRQQMPPPPIPWRTIYRRLNVHRSNVDLSIEESYHTLSRSYLHSSAREIDYELLCFARFIGLHRFCTERGIDELTFLDADVIVFDSDFLTKVRIPANRSLWTVHEHGSFLASMSCASIGDFVDFMLAFYQQPDRGKIVTAIETYGDDEIDANQQQKLRDREPAFDALGVKPKLFTDMYLFDLFLHDQLERSERIRGDAADPVARSMLPPYVHAWEKEETRVRNGGKDDGSSNASSEVVATSDYFALIENMRSVTKVPHTRVWLCLDQALFDAHFRISLSSQSARMNGSPDEEFKRLPGAHFQGDCKFQMMQLLYGDVIRKLEEMPDASVTRRKRRKK